jgi:hypothetical protein
MRRLSGAVSVRTAIRESSLLSLSTTRTALLKILLRALALLLLRLAAIARVQYSHNLPLSGTIMRIRSLLLTLFVCVTRAAFAGCPTPVLTQAPNLTGANGMGLVVADFNKDGKMDYAVADPANGNVVIYLGHGDGTFDTGVPYPDGGSGGGWPVGADFNGDGFTDIALFVGDGGAAYVSVLLNNGDGTFGAAQRSTIAVSSGAGTLRAVDLNNDGKMDLIVGGQYVQIFNGAGNGTFSSVDYRYPPVAPGTSRFVATAIGADLNNDGLTDLIVTTTQVPISGSSTYSLSIYMSGPGGLPLVPTTTYSARSGLQGDILSIDLDGDGFRDLVATYPADGIVSTYRNRGDGTFDAPVEYHVDMPPFSETVLQIAAGDINEDGITDLVFGAANAIAATMMVGNGDGTFQAAYHFPLSASHYTLQMAGVGIADFNGDGRPDILLSQWDTPEVFLVTNSCPSRYVSLMLGSSANPSSYGSAVTITATVNARDGGHASGMVSFFDGGSPLGSATLSGTTPSIATVIVPKLALGAHAITASYSGDATYGASSGKLTQTVNRPAFGVPLDFRATGDPTANTIALQWIGSTNATGYEISRMSGGKWNVIWTTGAAESYTDAGVSASHAYFYRVRALMTGSAPSGDSTPDAATTYSFAHTVSPGGGIFAADMSDLRICANNLRLAAGLVPASFTDGGLSGVFIQAVHMTELRNALSLAMTTAGMPPPSFSRSIVAGNTVLAADFNDLRTMMR